MRRSWHLTFGNERGSVFLAGLVLVTILTFLGLALFDLARIEGALVIQDTASTQALYQAEAALSYKIVEINDPLRRVALIASITGAPAGTTVTLTSDTVTVGGAAYARTVVSSDGPTGGEKYMTAAISPPTAGDTERVLRVTLGFLDPTFQYAAVANNGDLILRGTGGVPGSGPGGADLVNGDLFIRGNVFLGTPGSATPDVKVTCLTVLSDCTDSRPTISQPVGTSFIVNNPQGDAAFPQNEALKTGLQPDMPIPDVPGYVSALKTAVGVAGSDPMSGGSMTGTYRGSPVYNLAAIFSTLGTNGDGSLRSPSGCGCGGSPTGSCALYCTLQPLGLKKNPTDRLVEAVSTPGDDYYFDGVRPGGELISGKTGQRGAQRRVDFNISSQPPIFVADGNVRFSAYDSYGFAINARATMVATRDLILSDNMIYQGGNTDTNPLTADLIALVAQRDVWFGDPEFGTFYEGSGVMLAGRDFNYVFYDNLGNSKTPENAVTLNGTMLANRQIAVFRDFANPTNANGTCPAGTTGCRPAVFYRSDTSCGSVDGCWRFITRDSDGNILPDTSIPAFQDCGAGSGGCAGATRKITHYQMTLSYETRLRTNSSLVPPGLPTGASQAFSSFYSWIECRNPTCS
ncbi:MAG: hypothetical protein HYV93_24585 [Candidatus Rokubacteria bacterium]|nr:hypothetical protein [Candidatus Rokubacteria bacterium]